MDKEGECHSYDEERGLSPERMSEFMTRLSVSGKDMEEKLSNIAKNHMDFERIHPFADGNGRTGRMVLNQQLINEKLLPIIIAVTIRLTCMLTPSVKTSYTFTPLAVNIPKQP